MTEDSKAGTKSSKPALWLVSGLVAALLLGGGAFVGTQFLLRDGTDTEEAAADNPNAAPAAGLRMEYLPLDTLVVNVPRTDPPRHLRFQATLELPAAHSRAVTEMTPRIMDVMNTYLRATELNDLREPTSLLRIRAHLLRRIQTVTPDGYVTDLLVSEFIVN